MTEIQPRQKDIITTTQNIREEAVNVFKEYFVETKNYVTSALVNNIPQLISQDQNQQMERMTIIDEVK